MRESFDDFYACVRGMALTMKSKMPERSLVNLMRRNLKPRIRNLIFGCRIETLADLKTECRRAEKHVEDLESKFSKRRSIDEVSCGDFKEDEETAQIEAFERHDRNSGRPDARKKHSSGPTKEKPGGIGCDSQFHELVCYKCNQAGARLVVCEKCGPENRFNGSKTGSACQEKKCPEDK